MLNVDICRRVEIDPKQSAAGAFSISLFFTPITAGRSPKTHIELIRFKLQLAAQQVLASRSVMCAHCKSFPQTGRKTCFH